MLIDLGIALAWIAMSAAGALGLALLGRAPMLGRGSAAALDAHGEQDVAYEELYPFESSRLAIEAWR